MSAVVEGQHRAKKDKRHHSPSGNEHAKPFGRQIIFGVIEDDAGVNNNVESGINTLVVDANAVALSRTL